MRNLAKDQHGTTFVFVLVFLFGFLALAIGGLGSATSALRVSRNYQAATQAMVCAESGLLHAQQLIDRTGVIRFNVDILPRWSALWGAGAVAMPGSPDCAYTVTTAQDAVNPVDFMVATSTGTGADGATRTVRARLTLGNVFSPGAIYLPDPGVSSTFNGDKFLVDGNDTNLDGSPGPAGAIPGIATSTSGAASAVSGALSSTQEDNVIGLGGDASVLPASGPDVNRINTEIIPAITSQLGVLTNPLIVGGDVFGTLLVPQITYFTSSVHLSGNVSGAGILVVDGGLTMNGNLDFTGLILVRGTTQITTASGNSTILGAIWTTDLELTVAGSASVTYSRQALELVNAIGTGNHLPQRVRAVAWSRL